MPDGRHSYLLINMLEENHVKIITALTPLSLLYGVGVSIRNKLFDWGILSSEEFDIPVISVGNLTVGGTGKTPHIEYLIRLFSEKYRVAVLSRGYKRKTKGFILAHNNSTSAEIGDEPYQILKKFPNVVIAVDTDRRRGIRKLTELEPAIDVVLLDDAFQHRYVSPLISIILTDHHRPIYDDKLLPAGKLREPISSLYRANIVIVTKCPEDIKPIDFRIISRKLNLYPYQDLYFSHFTYTLPKKMFGEEEELSLSSLTGDDSLLLVTGIANPASLYQYIKNFPAHSEAISFPDHHNFTLKDIKTIENKFKTLPGKNKYIITTEKDTARLCSSPFLSEELKSHFYNIPISVDFLQNANTVFSKKIIETVQKNRRSKKK